MKKIMMPMIVLMVVVSAMSFTSCTNDLAEAIGDGISRELIDEPTIRGTWSNYVEDNNEERIIRYLQLHRTGGTDNRDFSLVEVQKGKRFITYGEWTLSRDCKTLVLRVKSGNRPQQSITCAVVESKFGFLSIRFEGKVYSFNEVKSKELNDYIDKQ